MSYIHDDVQMIKTVIKFIDKDKIVDFLNSIQFKSDEDVDADRYIFQTYNSELIEYYIDNYLQIHELIATVDELNENNELSDMVITIIKNRLVKEKDSDNIYKILNSTLVTWNRGENPFETGFYCEYDNPVSTSSILNQEEVNVLFGIYASDEDWYVDHTACDEYIRDKEALIDHIRGENLLFSRNNYAYIGDVYDSISEEDVKDFFNGDVPDTVSIDEYADMLIKYVY